MNDELLQSDVAEYAHEREILDTYFKSGKAWQDYVNSIADSFKLPDYKPIIFAGIEQG